MLDFKGKAVYLCCGKTDMRKSIDGLMAIVQRSFKLDPFNGALFVFCNRNRDRIKILEWDTDGFWLYFKRLEKGHFKWPGLPARAGCEAPDQARIKGPGRGPVEESTTMALSGEELGVLLNGVRIELKIRRNEVKERMVI